MTDRGYIGQVFELRPVLAAMEDEGMPIDDTERIRLGEEFDKAQEELRGWLVERAGGIGRVQPKQGYKGIPPEIKQFGDLEMKQTPMKDKDGEVYRYAHREFPELGTDPVTGEPVERSTTRWCRVYEFNPNSRDQVILYAKSKGHKVPKDKHRENEEGENPETTNAKELTRLANQTGDVFYLKVVEYRGFSKLRGTYVDGFQPQPDGCVHTTFTFDTAIGQLSSRNPNIQNFPKLKPTPRLALAMRRMVRAKPGKIIVEWDYKSCHVITLGFLAEDETWIRLGRLDMHSFVAGHVMGLWDGPTILKESDAELMARFKWFKSDPVRKLIRDDQAKHAILGVGNGLKARGLFERYMENFPPNACRICGGSGKVPGVRKPKMCVKCKGRGMASGLQTSQLFLDTIETLAPKVFVYQQKQRQYGHDRGQKGNISPFGFIRRFYEVYVFNKRWRPEVDLEPPFGEQAEQAVSFLHMNIAHCHLRAAMKELFYSGIAGHYGMFDQIHDSLLFHFDENLLDEHVREVYPILHAPSRILKHPTIAPEGLVIDVEGTWGPDWAERHEIKIPEELNERPKIPAVAAPRPSISFGVPAPSTIN